MNDVQNDLMQNIGSGGNDTKMRQYLIVGGGVFVVFVVGIVIAKFAFSSPKQDTQVILPPEMKTTSAKSKKEDDTELFNSIPIENSKTNEVKKEVTKEVTNGVKNEVKKGVVERDTKQKEEEFKKPVVEEIDEKNKVPVEPVKEVKKIEKTEPVKVKKVVEKPKKESIKKVVKTTAKNYPYFIQVAAVTRGEPSKKFLKLIEKNGFHYKIQVVNIKGVKVKRVLIGSFETSKQAKAVLSKIKQKISSSAFIKKLK
jgi:DedD protein